MTDRHGEGSLSIFTAGDAGRRDNQHNQHGGLFSEINNLRIPQLEDQADLDEKERAKYNDTPFGLIAKHKAFEIVTLTIISLNAVSIGYDTDYDVRWGKAANLYDGPVGFIFVEWAFAIYFSVEVFIRFFAYKNKIDCLFDAWFVFDTVLVTMMVVETWVLPFVGSGGPLGQLSILRLLRLLRITRMARLMRAVPEMMVIVKGMIASTRTVACTGALLVLALYIFGILFTAEYHQGSISDSDESITEAGVFFGSMGKSMFTLFIMGTVLDDYTQATNAVRSSGNYWMLLAFILFTLLSSFMMLNMLIGILVEVIAATSEGEEYKAREADVRESIREIFEQMDKDSNKEISKAEFMAMKDNPKVMDALAAMDIHNNNFHLYAELFFRPEEEGGGTPTLSYDRLVTMIFRLRPGTSINRLDFATFEGVVLQIYDRIRVRVEKIERLCVDIAQAMLGPLGDDDIPIRCMPTMTTAGENDCGQSQQMKHQTNHLTVPDASSSRKKADSNKPGPLNGNGASEDTVTSSTQKPSARSARSAMSASDRQRLRVLSDFAIIDELQRRAGIPNFEETGVPYSMLDEELQARLRTAIEQNGQANLNQLTVQCQSDEAPARLGAPDEFII